MKVECREMNLIQLSQDEPIGRSFVAWEYTIGFLQSNVVTFLTSEGISCTVRAKNSEVRKRCNIEVRRKPVNVFLENN
jgi:hypothetical protein